MSDKLCVPPEGLEAMQGVMPAMHDLAAAFLSAIQPRQERALQAALRMIGPGFQVSQLQEDAYAAFYKVWNADAGREEAT